MKSHKELSLDDKILGMLSGKARHAAEVLIRDHEIQHMQEYANTVSIKRLNFNDHGPVHMRKVVINAVTMLDILHSAGVKTNLEREECGTFEDSKIAVICAGFLHDIGMTIGRENHELMGTALALPIIDRILRDIYGDDVEKRVVARALIVEGIVGHMGTQQIHSLEAGLILIADGCDMEKGRARIPLMLNTESKVGDIHKYSAAAIENVKLEKGEQRPLKITVEMTASVGFFQIEEVLFKKINSSPVKPYIELYAGVTGRDVKCYL